MFDVHPVAVKQLVVRSGMYSISYVFHTSTCVFTFGDNDNNDNILRYINPDVVVL